ncbi:hypothetical protein [Neisseria sp.]|uniref:hypothetical protein n=1 Tax=Neisseria sp. TaxID=192066 RepID=UPI0026DADAAB|nr:hypothetical protein [Neisseria sp.]MDO4226701.1 hypothetical protein [Neisseria sp.]
MNNNDLKRIYFETSAMNYFFDNHTIADAIATKAFQNMKGRGWYLSPVVLWEVLLTTNEDRRENLLYFAQHLYQEDLLPSPEELIVKYIESGCPVVQKRYPLISKGIFSEPWREICQVKEKTLYFEYESLSEKTKIIRSAVKYLHDFFKFQSIDLSGNHQTVSQQLAIQEILNKFNLVPQEFKNVPEAINHYRLVVFYILLILCIGISLDNQVIEKFWSKMGIENIAQRIEYIFESYPDLVLRGPFQPIAFMTAYQSKNKYSRGVYFDSLHVLYSVYVESVISADEHFRMYRENIFNQFQEYPNIINVDEINWVYHERKNPVEDSFLILPPNNIQNKP